MKIRFAPYWMGILVAFANSAGSQQADVVPDVQEGYRLAVGICSACHLAARDQRFEPALQPPAPSFESIAQRVTTNADSIRTFLKTTDRNINNPHGMPNLQLLDTQITNLVAYLMSLRKP
jgi:mono/diheme cytochrome c family protein